MLGPLASAFCQALAPAWADELEGLDLDARLVAFVSEARREWPDLDVDEVEFIAYAGAAASRGDGPVAWLAAARAADLWLAFACTKGNTEAIKAFEHLFAQDIRRSIQRFGSTASEHDELRQALRDKLFVGTESKAPKLASYAGLGFLQNWLRVTATRMFIDRRRGKKAGTPEAPLDVALIAQSDFEFGFLKARHRDDFRAAFADAVAALTPGERNLLRRRLEGLSVDQLGALEGVHRSTAARRLGRARHRLLEETRRNLGERLGLDRSALDSVMRQAQTLDVSLERLLHEGE